MGANPSKPLALAMGSRHADLARSRLRLRGRNQRRRARIALAPRYDFSPEQWQELLTVFQHRCAYCGQRRMGLEQEHLTPVVAQGSYTLHNIVPACPACNRRKGTGAVLTPVQPLLLTVARSARPGPAPAP